MRAQMFMLMICTDGWGRRPEMEMKAWDWRGTPDHLPENEDDGQDIEPEDF